MLQPAASADVRLVVESNYAGADTEDIELAQRKVDDLHRRLAALLETFEQAKIEKTLPAWGKDRLNGSQTTFSVRDGDHQTELVVSVMEHALDPAPDSFRVQRLKVVHDRRVLTEDLTLVDTESLDMADPLPWVRERVSLWLKAAERPMAKRGFDNAPWTNRYPLWEDVLRILNTMRQVDGLPRFSRELQLTKAPGRPPILGRRAYWAKEPSVLSEAATRFLGERMPDLLFMTTSGQNEVRFAPFMISTPLHDEVNTVELMKTLRDWPDFAEPFFIEQALA